jgi:hypothetical protein
MSIAQDYSHIFGEFMQYTPISMEYCKLLFILMTKPLKQPANQPKTTTTMAPGTQLSKPVPPREIPPNSEGGFRYSSADNLKRVKQSAPKAEQMYDPDIGKFTKATPSRHKRQGDMAQKGLDSVNFLREYKNLNDVINIKTLLKTFYPLYEKTQPTVLSSSNPPMKHGNQPILIQDNDQLMRGKTPSRLNSGNTSGTLIPTSLEMLVQSANTKKSVVKPSRSVGKLSRMRPSTGENGAYADKLNDLAYRFITRPQLNSSFRRPQPPLHPSDPLSLGKASKPRPSYV